MIFDLAAVTRTQPAEDLPPGVESVTLGDLRAVLAPVGRPHGARPDRRAVARKALQRQRLLEALMPGGPVLAVAPGTRMTRAGARSLLAGQQAALAALLRELDGIWQYQAVLGWDRSRALSRFATSPEIGPLLARGRVCEQSLATAVRELSGRLASEAVLALRACARDIVELPRDPDMLLNAALLVEVGREPELEAALGNIDAIWTEGFRIRLIGPSPAVSFHTLALREIVPREAERAAGLLGLDGAGAEGDLPGLRREALATGAAQPGEIAAAFATLQAIRAAPPDGPAFVIETLRDGTSAATEFMRVA